MSLLAGGQSAEATVRLTDRTGRAKQFRLNAKGLILGSAPGCDIRLDPSVPPVLVLLAACPGGVLIRRLAPLARIEVNGQPWQAGICPYPARVSLGEILVELEGPPPGAEPVDGAPEPTGQDSPDAGQEHGADRWFRKARHLLRLMRGLVTGASGSEKESGERQAAEQALPAVSPALETAWQMLRVAQEQHRDDLVRLERERALVATRWAEMERDRVEREATTLAQKQARAELETREDEVVSREARVTQTEQELNRQQIDLKSEAQKIQGEKQSLEQALASFLEREGAFQRRELDLEGREAAFQGRVRELEPEGLEAQAQGNDSAKATEKPEAAPEPPRISPPVAEPHGQVLASVVPVIPEAWFGPSAIVAPGETIVPSLDNGKSPNHAAPPPREEPLPEHPGEAGGEPGVLPVWACLWFRARFAAAAKGRAGQLAGPAIWDATGQVGEADSQLAKTISEWGMAETGHLDTLLAVARQERRPLRSLLLGDGVLGMHQLSQVESGRPEGLHTGPLVILERLPCGSREVVHAVHDPRRGADGVLHQLEESEMADAARPDEFVQRATAVGALESENLQAVWEVLEIDGRPAVLREGVSGSGSEGWSTLAAVPGVWYRLVLQAALGLRDLHSAGLCHGRLEASHVVATPTGLVKLMNPSMPPWLSGLDQEESPKSDLKALGRLARQWLSDENRPGPKPKPLPAILGSILDRLEGMAGPPIPTAVELADELDRAGSQVPGNAAALQRFLAEIRADTGLEKGAVSA